MEFKLPWQKEQKPETKEPVAASSLATTEEATKDKTTVTFKEGEVEPAVTPTVVEAGSVAVTGATQPSLETAEQAVEAASPETTAQEAKEVEDQEVAALNPATVEPADQAAVPAVEQPAEQPVVEQNNDQTPAAA